MCYIFHYYVFLRSNPCTVVGMISPRASLRYLLLWLPTRYSSLETTAGQILLHPLHPPLLLRRTQSMALERIQWWPNLLERPWITYKSTHIYRKLFEAMFMVIINHQGGPRDEDE